MKKFKLRHALSAALCCLVLPTSSAFAQTKINQLPIGTVSGGYVTICDNLTTTYACTYNQVAAWFNTNLSLILPSQTGLGGDCLGTNGTVASWVACGSGGGGGTFNAITSGTNTNALTVGTGGVLTISGTGVINANQVNGAVVPTSAAVLASNSSSQAMALTLGGDLAVASGVLQTTQPINAQTGTTYAIATNDAGRLITFSNASSIAVTLSQATTTGFTAGFSFDAQNLGAGTVTITPATSTINGASTLTIAQNTGCTVTSDGTNYQVSACTAVGGGGGGGAGSFTTLSNTGLANLANGLTQAANTSVDGLTLVDSTVASTGNQQFSPRLRLTGQGWKTTATAASQTVDWIIENQPVQGSTNPTSNLVISSQINGGGYTNKFQIASTAGVTVGGNISNIFGGSVSTQAVILGTGGAPTAAGIYMPSTNVLGFMAASAQVGTWSSTLLTELTPVINGATPFTVSGCGAAAGISGNGAAGTFTVGTGAATCTFVFTINGATGMTAPHGWIANVDDVTAKIHCANNGTVASTTTATVLCNSTVTTGDLITFSATAF